MIKYLITVCQEVQWCTNTAA